MPGEGDGLTGGRSGAAGAAATPPERLATVALTADDEGERLAAGLQASVGDALRRVCEMARDVQAGAPPSIARRLDGLVVEAIAAREAMGEALARLARGTPAPPAGGDGDGAGAGTVRRPLRLLVIDHQPVLRRGIAATVRTDPGMVVGGEAPGVAAALAVAARARPDVVLFGYRMADMRAPEAVPRLRAALPAARLLLFTGERAEAPLEAVLRAGVDGCLLADAPPAELLDAIRRVAAGERVLDPRLPAVRSEAARPRLPAPLTRREYEVLRRVAMGETNEEVARALGLSRNTVKTYLQGVLRKLGARNRVEALARAAETGLL